MVLDNLLNIRSEVWIALIVTLTVYVVNNVLWKRKKNYPPGPTGLPVVGYVPFLKDDVHLQFIELSKKYGEVFSLRLGSTDVVVLNGTASIREAFSKPEFLGRPPQGAFELLGNKSPFFDHDMNVWKDQRRFVVQAMKDLGLGKSKIEEHIQDEIKHFLKVLKSHGGKPMNLLEPLTASMSNNICSLVFGKRYEYDNPDRILLDKSLDEVSKIIAQSSSHIFFPWIMRIPFIQRWMNLEKGVKAYKDMDDLFEKEIEEHKKTLDPKNSRDFIDSYLVEMESRKEKTSNTTFTFDTLIGSVSDLFGAGSETMRTSIRWCMYVMAALQDVQKRVEQEILEVLGPDRTVEHSDQKLMPFTHAVILEIMRWKTIIPLNLLRYTTGDTTVAGYNIPKNITVMTNFWAVHHDPKNWKNPESFQPERFLSSDKKSVVKSPHFMPFSSGKRACPGEAMAYMELFLYFVSILQKFNVRLPEGCKPTFDAELTITYRLKPHKICFISKE